MYRRTLFLCVLVQGGDLLIKRGKKRRWKFGKVVKNQ